MLTAGGIHLMTNFNNKLDFWSGKHGFSRKLSKYDNFQVALEPERFFREKNLNDEILFIFILNRNVIYEKLIVFEF